MNQSKDELTTALRRLADEDAAMTASPHVEARLREEVRLIARARAHRTRVRVMQIAAAVVLVAAATAWWTLSHRQAPPEPAAPEEVVTQYFPLFYSSVPAEVLHVVRMEVPRESLARFGLLPGDALGRATGTVLADVLVGDDGLARAVRFVQKVSQEP